MRQELGQGIDIVTLLKKLADNTDRESLAAAYRRRRFALFRRLIAQVPRPLRILDVGGTRRFWQSMEFCDEPGVEIVLLNITPSELDDQLGSAGKGRTALNEVLGDARAMPQFADNEFDIVFSNSVIEHVGSFEDQRRMMREIERVGQRYFIQTPNFYFPVEPHFHVLGFQFLPVRWRAALLRHFNLGWTERVSDPLTAEAIVRSVRLLTRRELLELCPEARLYSETVLGLTKSFIAYRGWEDIPAGEGDGQTERRI